MAKGSNQKQKLLYLAKIFFTETDEQHGLTLSEITARLRSYDIFVERKTLYQDFEELRHFGLDIIARKEGRSYHYLLASRAEAAFRFGAVLQIHHGEQITRLD